MKYEEATTVIDTVMRTQRYRLEYIMTGRAKNVMLLFPIYDIRPGESEAVHVILESGNDGYGIITKFVTETKNPFCVMATSLEQAKAQLKKGLEAVTEKGKNIDSYGFTKANAEFAEFIHACGNIVRKNSKHTPTIHDAYIVGWRTYIPTGKEME